MENETRTTKTERIEERREVPGWTTTKTKRCQQEVKETMGTRGGGRRGRVWEVVSLRCKQERWTQNTTKNGRKINKNEWEEQKGTTAIEEGENARHNRHNRRTNDTKGEVQRGKRSGRNCSYCCCGLAWRRRAWENTGTTGKEREVQQDGACQKALGRRRNEERATRGLESKQRRCDGTCWGTEHRGPILRANGTDVFVPYFGVPQCARPCLPRKERGKSDGRACPAGIQKQKRDTSQCRNGEKCVTARSSMAPSSRFPHFPIASSCTFRPQTLSPSFVICDHLGVSPLFTPHVVVHRCMDTALHKL